MSYIHISRQALRPGCPTGSCITNLVTGLFPPAIFLIANDASLASAAFAKVPSATVLGRIDDTGANSPVVEQLKMSIRYAKEIVADKIVFIDLVERLAHPRRGWKPEFKEGRCPPLDGAACSLCIIVLASHCDQVRKGILWKWYGLE